MLGGSLIVASCAFVATACGGGRSAMATTTVSAPATPRRPTYVGYPSPRQVAGYRLVRPPIVAIVTLSGELDLYMRLNRRLSLRAIDVEPITTGGPTISGGRPGMRWRGFAGMGWQVLRQHGDFCYEARIDIFPPKNDVKLPGAITVGPFPNVAPGSRVHISFDVLPGRPPLQAIVPLAPPLPPEQVAPNAVSDMNPYLRVLGCPPI
jgi:hypothetical protein